MVALYAVLPEPVLVGPSAHIVLQGRSVASRNRGFRAVPRGDLHRFAVMAAIGGLGHVGGSDIELQLCKSSQKPREWARQGSLVRAPPRSVRPTFPVGWAPWGAGTRAGRRG